MRSITSLPLLPSKLQDEMQVFSYAGMSKGVCGGKIVPPVLFSEQAGHVAYTLTINLTVDPDLDSNQCFEVRKSAYATCDLSSMQRPCCEDSCPSPLACTLPRVSVAA